jgi:hypothetical protein
MECQALLVSGCYRQTWWSQQALFFFFFFFFWFYILNNPEERIVLFANDTSVILTNWSRGDLNYLIAGPQCVNICNTEFLGLMLDNTFSWKTHRDTIVPKLSSACFAIRTIKPLLKLVYFSYFHSIMTYGLIFCRIMVENILEN